MNQRLGQRRQTEHREPADNGGSAKNGGNETKPPSPPPRWWKNPNFWNPAGTIVIAIFTIVLAAEACLQYQLLEGQDTREKLDRRPWVTLDDDIAFTGPLDFGDDGVTVSISGIVRNGGKSIAKNVSFVGGNLLVQPLIPEDVPISSWAILSCGRLVGPRDVAKNWLNSTPIFWVA